MGVHTGLIYEREALARHSGMTETSELGDGWHQNIVLIFFLLATINHGTLL